MFGRTSIKAGGVPQVKVTENLLNAAGGRSPPPSACMSNMRYATPRVPFRQLISTGTAATRLWAFLCADARQHPSEPSRIEQHQRNASSIGNCPQVGAPPCFTTSQAFDFKSTASPVRTSPPAATFYHYSAAGVKLLQSSPGK